MRTSLRSSSDGGTIKTYLTHIYSKLDIHSHSELLVIVYDAKDGKG